MITLRNLSMLWVRWLSVLLVVSLVCGCSAKKRVSAIGNTFLEDVDISHKEETLPFEHSWINWGIKDGSYNSVYIKPVRTDLIPKTDWGMSKSPYIRSEEDFLKETEFIASHFHRELLKDLEAHKEQRIKVADAPGPGVAVLEIALTEAEFSHPAARAASLAAPVPGTGALVGAISDPHAAFAARLTDGESGELIATVADRKFPPTRIVDLNKLTVTSSVREVCSIWAETLADALQKGRMAKVKDRGSFSILPY